MNSECRIPLHSEASSLIPLPRQVCLLSHLAYQAEDWMLAERSVLLLQFQDHKHNNRRKQHQTEDSQRSYCMKPHLPSLGLLVRRDNSISLMFKPLLLAVNCICKLVQSLRNVTWQYISILNAHNSWPGDSTYLNFSHRYTHTGIKEVYLNILITTVHM